MEVTLLLSPRLASALSGAGVGPARDALNAALGRWHDRIRPVSPGAQDSEMSRYFVVDIPDPDEAESVRKRLAQLPEVEGAYIKPPEALP